jgi:O-antigen ligase
MRRIALWLSWLLLFIVPWEYLFEKGTLGTLVRTAGIGLAGVWALSVVAALRVRQPHPLHLLMIAFALWCAASILWSLDPEASRLQVETYAQLVLLALIVWDLYEEPAHLNTGLQAYVLGCWVCIAELLEVFLAGEMQRRFSVGAFNENTLGFTLSLGLPVAWYLATVARAHEGMGGRLAPALRISNLAFIPVALFGIALTASRSSMACGLLAVGYMVVSLGGVRRGARILLFGGAAALAMYGVSLIPKTSADRLENTTVELSDGDWNGRLPTWKEAFRMISERPLAGVGVKAFQVGAVETRAAPHNLVLSITAELGLVGLVLFSSILLGCALVAFRQPRPLALFWLVMLVSWTLNALLHNFEDKKFTWLMFGMIAVSGGLYRTPSAAPAAAPVRARPAAAPPRPVAEGGSRQLSR